MKTSYHSKRRFNLNFVLINKKKRKKKDGLRRIGTYFLWID